MKLDAKCLPVAEVPASSCTTEVGDALPAEPSLKRYHGVVKYWRGSFGWITSPEVADMYPAMDVFMHKKDCESVPKRFCNVSFLLALDEKGNPKAVEARVEDVHESTSP